MANGTLVRVLIHTGVTRYLSFKAVDGGYVFNKGKVQSLFSFIFIIFFIVSSWDASLEDHRMQYLLNAPIKYGENHLIALHVPMPSN